MQVIHLFVVKTEFHGCCLPGSMSPAIGKKYTANVKEDSLLKTWFHDCVLMMSRHSLSTGRVNAKEMITLPFISKLSCFLLAGTKESASDETHHHV
jgi:hypothetical protein